MADTSTEQAQGQPARPELTNTLFPPPPAYYKAFTPANLARHAELAGSSRTKDRGDSSDGHPAEPQGLSDEQGKELKRLSSLLEPPQADWVMEEGRWKCFGEVYTVESKIPTAEEIGVPPWVNPSEPPQTTLPPMLHSFLHTLLLLLEALTTTAPTPGELQGGHTGAPYIEHLCNLAATMMVATNQLRGAQAEATMVMLMEKQIETRRAQTEALRQKSRAIATSIQSLRGAVEELEGSQGGDAMDVDGDNQNEIKTPA